MTPLDVRRFIFLPRRICLVTSFEHYENDKSEGIFEQFSSIWHVSSYGNGLGLFLLCWRDAANSNYQIVHGLPSPPFFHPDVLVHAERDCLEF